MYRALSSPARNLIAGLIFVLAVMVAATTAYVAEGWSLGDAFYMVVLTVFTVGFDEVRPIDTATLRAITIGLILLGCTGMIFVTGALVQFITATQFSELLDKRRMAARIETLEGHVIVCGFGRIGRMLSQELAAAKMPFVVIERSEARSEEAQADGYLCLRAEATEEEALLRARVTQARALATVLPDDAANVFITLSARSLNRDLTIIARGEATSTERKLIQAGADRVVLPAHIGAERIAEMVLFPNLEERTDDPRSVGAAMIRLGLTSEVVVAAAGSAWIGLPVRAIERAADPPFIIVEVERARTRLRASDGLTVAAGDGVLVVGRSVQAAVAGFAAPGGD